MTDVNTTFAGMLLRMSRADAKQAGVKVGKLSTWKDAHRTNPWFEVWEDDKGIVWQGSASNASEAKSIYIASLIPEEEK